MLLNCTLITITAKQAKKQNQGDEEDIRSGNAFRGLNYCAIKPGKDSNRQHHLDETAFKLTFLLASVQRVCARVFCFNF